MAARGYAKAKTKISWKIYNHTNNFHEPCTFRRSVWYENAWKASFPGCDDAAFTDVMQVCLKAKVGQVCKNSVLERRHPGSVYSLCIRETEECSLFISLKRKMELTSSAIQSNKYFLEMKKCCQILSLSSSLLLRRDEISILIIFAFQSDNFQSCAVAVAFLWDFALIHL